MAIIENLCVYCGSRDGNGTGYARLAREMGRIMAAKKIRLIYGGGSVGTMGHIARSVLAEGGEVVGVIPTMLDDREVTFESCTELHVVSSMHARKKMLFDLADGFLILPGGLGTLEEMIEVITWRQLRMHEKPIVILNQSGFWQPYLSLIDHMIRQGFAGESTKELYTVVGDINGVLTAFEEAEDPWMESHSNLF